LRGRTKEQIISALRQQRADTLATASSTSATEVRGSDEQNLLRLEDRVHSFWQAGDELATFAVNPHDPAVDKGILKRLGNGPFSIGAQNVAELLSNAYDEVHKAVMRKVEEMQS
jgi:uncharacterized Zn finger protein